MNVFEKTYGEPALLIRGEEERVEVEGTTTRDGRILAEHKGYIAVRFPGRHCWTGGVLGLRAYDRAEIAVYRIIDRAPIEGGRALLCEPLVDWQPASLWRRREKQDGTHTAPDA